MKKLLFAGAISALSLTSCTATRQGYERQNERAEVLRMKGDWQITGVTSDSGFLIRPFDEGVQAKCFEGSIWKLVPNNFKGSYTLNGAADCPSLTRNIMFDVRNNVFSFKKVEDGTRAKDNLAGYELQLIKSSDDAFTLQQQVPFEGRLVQVNYNFVKLK